MKSDESFGARLRSCPEPIRPTVDALIKLIRDGAASDSVDDLHGTLKWGELAFLAKSGSTIRIGWNNDQPEICSLYFNCNSKLVETFRILYPDQLQYRKNRQIVLDIRRPLAVEPLKHCVRLALTYHKRKHLPLLGQ